MKIFLVGGAVRDKLLGLPIKERDWVVVGATSAEMVKLGFCSVGKDFPVFLEPKTKEEYALARTERKVGRGYTGFDFNTSVNVTLEEDLKRRDLTINAMAEDVNGQLIDYYGGKDDLNKKLLRHVSPAFAEDPVRILRVARFAARYAQYGFTVAPETAELMKAMVANGEVDALVPERVWKELERALGEKNPEEFFRALFQCGALAKLFPELISREKAHFLGENNLIKATQATEDKVIRFAALLSELSDSAIETLCKRFRIPTEYRELALKRIENRKQHSAESLFSLQSSESVTQIAETIFKLLTNLDAFRREERFLKIMQKAAILEVPNTDIIRRCFLAAKGVSAKEFLNEGVTGKELGEKMNNRRCELIENIVRDYVSKMGL